MVDKFRLTVFDRFCLVFPPGWLVLVHRHWNYYHPEAKSFSLVELLLFLLPGGQYLAILLKRLRSRKEESQRSFDEEYQRAFHEEVLARLCNRQFSPELVGVERLPEEPPVLLVMNHAGLPFPWDFVAFACCLREATGWNVQPLAHPDLFDHPLVKLLLPEGWALALGGIRAGRQELKVALQTGTVIILAPEGARGPGKGWTKRYRLEPFDPAFLSLSKRYEVPLHSAICVGSEEISRWAENWRRAAKAVRLPLLPISPLTPLVLLYPSLLFWGMKTKMRFFIQGEIKLDPGRGTRAAYLAAQSASSRDAEDDRRATE